MGAKDQTESIAFAALVATLSNMLSFQPFVIAIVVGSFPRQNYLNQLPIFLGGILAGLLAILLTGAVGWLYVSYQLERQLVHLSINTGSLE